MRLLPVVALALIALPYLAAEETKEEKRCHWKWKGESQFAWTAQLDIPAKDLGRALDNRTGLGIGMQWARVRENGTAHRTRLEWNLFSEGNPVDGLRTKVSNYVLSFDRIHSFTGKAQGPYLMGGLGAVRWFVDRTPASAGTERFHTTKLAVTGGLGWRFSPSFSVEGRYMVSSVDRTFDGNVVQLCAGVRF